MISFERICGHLFNQPHLYHPAKAETVIRQLGPRLIGNPVRVVNGQGGTEHSAFANGRPSFGIVGDQMGRVLDNRGILPFDVVENVAIIPIEGTLVYKGGWIGSESGETSYQGLRTQIARAASSDRIKGVVFEVDSFGGQGNGVFETARDIGALSVAKPTISILTDYAYSAGYCLASQARQIVVPEFGGAGSIGVVMLHADFSQQMDQAGIDITIIQSGARKTEGNPYEPLPIDLRDRWKAQIDVMRDRFAGVVAGGRGNRLTKAKALETEAEAFSAVEAVERGLVDAVGDPLEAFGAFIEIVNQRA